MTPQTMCAVFETIMDEVYPTRGQWMVMRLISHKLLSAVGRRRKRIAVPEVPIVAIDAAVVIVC